MSFASWVSSLFQSRRPVRQQRRRSVRTHYCRPGMELLEDRITPSVYTVVYLGDSTTGSGISGDLPYCIDQANSNGPSSSNTILFGVSGSINLASTLPAIDNNLSLTVPSNFANLINGDSLGSVFTIDAGETVSFSALNITNGGASQGGGVLNNGTQTINNSTLSGNSATTSGGGIENNGTLTINNSTLSGNSASINGGGIDNSGTLTVNNSTFTNTSTEYGGGISNEQTLTINNSTISGNSVSFYGGGIDNGGTLTVDNSTISGNTANQFGGGIENGGTSTVSDSTISGNSSDTAGGGGIFSDGTLTVENSTVSGNSCTSTNQYGGGGIDNDGTMSILNSTISNNSVSGSGNLGGGIDFNSAFGGGSTLHDTIVAGNIAINSAADPDFAGGVNTSVTIGGVTYSEGYNLIGDGTGSSGFTNGDQVGTSGSPINAGLSTLQYNGGPTQTLALLGISPAINAGEPNGSSDLPEYDQRGPGFPRILGGRVDIGAYESVFLPSASLVAAAGGEDQNTVISAAFAAPMQALVTDAYGNPVSGVSVTFSAPSTGSTGIFSGSTTVFTNSQGIATAPTLTANHLPGSFTVTASVAGVAATASFNLTITTVPKAIAVSSGSGQKTQVDTNFASPLKVLVTDANKKPVAGITVVFEVPSTGPGAFASGPVAAVTNASGVATSPVLIADTTAGSFTVLASVAGVATQAKFNLTNTAGASASVFALAGSYQSAAIGKAYAKPLQAKVVDSFGNPVGGVTVTFSAPNVEAGGTFGHKITATAVTAANGIATAPAFTANSFVGYFSLAAFLDVGTPAYFYLANVSSAPAKSKADAGTPQTITVNQEFNTPLEVLVTNSLSHAVGGVWVTFSAPVSGASGQFNGNVSVQTDSSGIATAPNLTANTVAGKFNVTATVSGLPGSILFALTNLPDSPASVTGVTGSGQRSGPGIKYAIPLVTLVTDAYGNAIGGVTVTFTVQSSAGAGGSFSGDQTTVTVKTNAQGFAIAPVLTANDTSGTFTVDASILNVTPDAWFTLTNL